jgi:predicted transcriptional regulator
MSTQVTVTLPDDTYRRAEYLAQLTGRDIADVLAETIRSSLQPLGEQHTERPVTALSDADVVALAAAQMDTAQDQQLSALLDKQQTGRMTTEEQTILAALLQVYQDGLLREARALHEAVRRGLHSPLEP